MAQPYFNTQPRPGETRIGYGLRSMPQNIANSVLAPFQPGGRLNLFNGAFNPNTPNSLPNQGLGIIGKLFGIGSAADVQGDINKGLAYAFAPATGEAAPAKPPAATPATAKAVPAIGKYPFNIPQGALVTSGYRTPEHNKDVGGVANSFHTRRDQYGRGLAVDLVPGKGQTMAGLFAVARQQNPGADVINEGDHVHIEPGQGGAGTGLGTNASAFMQAANAVGLNQPMPQFDNSGYQQADQMFQQIQKNAMDPFAAVMQTTPMPELPKPDELKGADYAAGDAAFAAATPKNPFGSTPEEQASGQLKARRMDYFAGMAQALSSIDWSRGVGLGELFAKLGSGALMGAKHGDAEVQDKMDKFDAAMQQYNLALANRDDNKAREAANVANQNIQALNGYKRDLWQTQVTEWQKNEPRVENGVLITRTPGPDGQLIETHTPLDKSREAAALMGRANNAIAQANAHTEYGWQTYRANREFGGALLPYYMSDMANQGNYAGRDGIAAIGLSEGSIAATEQGRWTELYQRYMPNGGQIAADTEAEARRIAGVEQGKAPNDTQQATMNNYISSQLLDDFINAGKSWVLVGGPAKNPKLGNLQMNPSSAVTSSVAIRREQERKTRRTVDSKGRTSITESY